MHDTLSLASIRAVVGDALRYWEPRRVAYNLILTAVAAAWLFLTWPHFRESLSLQSPGLTLVLAAAANVCYSATYIPDIFLQYSPFEMAWKRWRWTLWVAGMLLAIRVANY
jgi:hypothetical protein